MTLMRQSASIGASAVLLLFMTGCGGGADLYPVKGQVTLDGKPMKGGGSIAFMPLTNQEGKTAGGIIDENGNYELTTNEPGDGSMIGEFRIVITQTVEEEPEATPDGTKPVAASAALAAGDRIPLVYGDPDHSPLKAKVEAKDLNEINFDLDKGARGPGPAPGEAMRGLDLRRTYASR